MKSPNVAIVHAYSPRNSGDGLLVELTERLVGEALPDALVTVIALDAAQFESSRFVQWGRTSSGRLPQRLEVALAGVMGPSERVRAVLASADVIVAVGGGYLRASTLSEGLKSYLGHTRQLRAVSRSHVPAVYLSQSIGPYPRRIWPRMRRLLAELHEVHVRDDRSLREVGGGVNVRRTPDLAVLEMSAVSVPEGDPAEPFAAPVVIARELARPGSYYSLLGQFSERGYDWALQSTGGGNNDVPITQRYSGLSAIPTLRDVLSAPERRVVVSTRLHGAMAALMAGFPAIHLGYERKSWGAFEDLGLQDFVVNARSVDEARVVDLIARVQTDPASYWRLIRSNLPLLGTQRGTLVAGIRDAVASERVSL